MVRGILLVMCTWWWHIVVMLLLLLLVLLSVTVCLRNMYLRTSTTSRCCVGMMDLNVMLQAHLVVEDFSTVAAFEALSAKW